MSRRSRWLVRVKRGNSTVTIYKADRMKNGRIYREFKLAYYNEIGKRTLQSINSFKKARRAADNVNVGLMKGEAATDSSACSRNWLGGGGRNRPASAFTSEKFG